MYNKPQPEVTHTYSLILALFWGESLGLSRCSQRLALMCFHTRKGGLWRPAAFWGRRATSVCVPLVCLASFSVQFTSVAQSCPTLCDRMNHSTPGLPVHHRLLDFIQTHAHWVGDAIQPSYPLSSPSPPAPTPSRHQGLFQWVNSSHEVAKVLAFQPRHQSFQWTPRTDLL